LSVLAKISLERESRNNSLKFGCKNSDKQKRLYLPETAFYYLSFINFVNLSIERAIIARLQVDHQPAVWVLVQE
jgi:hypothetical protein